jgi:hypothetical protein
VYSEFTSSAAKAFRSQQGERTWLAARLLKRSEVVAQESALGFAARPTPDRLFRPVRPVLVRRQQSRRADVSWRRAPAFHAQRRERLGDPNPFFDAAFYSAQNPEARANPPVHYLRRGAAQGLRPSQEFDPAWYLASYPDVAAAGIEPLSHFLRLGRAEGRLPAEPDDFSTVDEAKLVCLKRPTPRETMALFVTHASGREVKPHVPPYLAALAREDVSTILIVAADKPEAFVSEGLSNLVDGLYLRQNGGYDFAAWAHVARDLGRIASSSSTTASLAPRP